MARNIIVVHNKKESSFSFKKVDRASLYGQKKRIFLDEKEQVCSTAIVDNKSGLLVRSGDASSVYVDESFNFIEKQKLEAVDSDGKSVQKVESTLNVAQNLQKISENDLLDFDCSSYYALSEESLDPDLAKALESGDIFEFGFNYYADFQLETGILLKNEFGYVALIGLKTQPDWIENTNISGEKFESPDEDDEIDFGML